MKQFFRSFSSVFHSLPSINWVLLAFGFFLLNACSQEEELPEEFNQVAGFQLLPSDSVFLAGTGEQELKLFAKFTGAFGDEITLSSTPAMQIFVDGKKVKNPPRIPTDRERIFEVYAKIGQLKSRPIRISVLDVDPKTYLSSFGVSMGDSTKAPYAIAGKSFVDFKVSLRDYRGKEFPEGEGPSYSFFFDGVKVENLQRVQVTRTGEIPFWIEVGEKKSEVKFLKSRALPEFSKKYSLPVIFHIVHSGQAIGLFENPEQKLIAEVLEKTNDWLLGKSASGFRKGHNQVDPNFEFYLATTGPDGNRLEEAGIHRIKSDGKSLAYQSESSKKYLFDQMWDPNRYVNVFIAPVDGELSGYAFFPPSEQPTEPINYFYGIVINRKFITIYILIHEIGHFLGLPHTFSTGPSCTAFNEFPDTESYNQDLKKINQFLKTNCEGEYFYATNVMDYPPTVHNSVTLDQANRMRSTLEKGYFLPANPNSQGKISSNSWKGRVFDPNVKPID
jgi:hypothetical protein